MSEEQKSNPRIEAPGASQRLLGSLRDALSAADKAVKGPALEASAGDESPKAAAKAELEAAVREARARVGDGGEAAQPPPLPANRSGAAMPGTSGAEAGKSEPQTQRLRIARVASVEPSGDDAGRTRLIRGKSKVARNDFHQDPVVGWLVVVGGLGLGAFRPIFEGNNTVGRGTNQRIAIDFGDDTISTEEQAYIRYDSADRSFLFVPNLAKTNIVSINDRKPTAAVMLHAMDVITMGRTQLVFVPFCGEEFDWAELTDKKD